MKLFSAVFFSLFCLQAKSFIINCKYEDHPVESIYSCWVQSVEQFSNSTAVSGVKGNHLSWKNNNYFKVFRSFRVLKMFPRQITNFFQNLESIGLFHENIHSISKFYLKEFGEKLKSLSLNYNLIEVIDADLFEFNQNLEKIDLHSNRIRHIGQGAFGSLKSLKTFWLNSNPCTGEFDVATNHHRRAAELAEVVEFRCKSINY